MTRTTTLIVLVALAYLVGASACDDGGGGDFYTPCDSDGDCASGLTCRHSLADEFCTIECEYDHDCELEFGPDAFCTGYDTCVIYCGDGASCPNGSHCDMNSWCQPPTQSTY